MKLASSNRPNPHQPAAPPVKQAPAIRRPGRLPAWSGRGAIQYSLKVNQPGDPYEQQADRLADQVMGATGPAATVQRQSCACGRPMGPDGMCEACKQKQQDVQRESTAAAGPAAAPAAAPPAVQQALSRPGRPLDGATRGFMEARFGRDFSRVRVHTGDQAAASAEAVSARAYTHRADIVFGPGQYRPHTAGGRRLLAHELAHVLQQQSGEAPAAIQREENKPEEKKPQPAPDPAAGGAAKQPTAKTDVALLLDDSDLAKQEARTYAGTVIRATSGTDAAAKLKALGKPIGTLYIVSHSNRAGEVQVISGIGTISWVTLADFSRDLKGALPAGSAPDVVDFRGCKLGDAPAQMETFRTNVGATEARATDCWSFSMPATPLTAPDGTEITTPADIPAGMDKAFNQALAQHINGMKAADGTRVKNCIIGLKKGEKADQNLAKIRQIYFQNGGYLSAGWASPDFNENWQKGSICVKDMTASTSPCKLVIKK
jgi:hypothetical protein